MNETNRRMKDQQVDKTSNSGQIPIPSGNSIRYAIVFIIIFIIVLIIDR